MKGRVSRAVLEEVVDKVKAILGGEENMVDSAGEMYEGFTMRGKKIAVNV